MIKFRITLVLLAITFLSTYSQTTKQKVQYSYQNYCAEIDIFEERDYEMATIHLFENDSLFQKVRKIKINDQYFPLATECSNEKISPLVIYGEVSEFSLTDSNNTVLANCFTDGNNYELQWLSPLPNDNSIIQWEMVQVNMYTNYNIEDDVPNYGFSANEDESSLFTRSIDKTCNPEDFELTIEYFDKNNDGIIDKIVSTTVCETE